MRKNTPAIIPTSALAPIPPNPRRITMSEAAYVILRSTCTGGGGHEYDGGGPAPTADISSSHRSAAAALPRTSSTPTNGHVPAASHPRRTVGSKSKRRLPAALETMPIWCDVTILPDPTGSGGGGDEISMNGSNDTGGADVLYHVKNQVFNPCGMDNLIVFPADFAGQQYGNGVGGSGGSGKYLLSLSSCRTTTSMTSTTTNPDGEEELPVHFEVDGADGTTTASVDNPTILDPLLSVRPEPSTFAFSTDGQLGGGGYDNDGGDDGNGIAYLNVAFDFGPAYRALQMAVAEAEEESEAIGKAKSGFWSNPMSWFTSLTRPKSISEDDLERMLDEIMHTRYYYNYNRQYSAPQPPPPPPTSSGAGAMPAQGGTAAGWTAGTTSSSGSAFTNQDLIFLQAAMDREIRDLNIMLSVLTVLGIALVGSYVYTARRLLQRSSPTSPPPPPPSRRGEQAGKEQRVDSEINASTITNIAASAKLTSEYGRRSNDEDVKDERSDISTAPSTPATPSPRGRRQSAKPVQVHGGPDSPERKEAINALLARVKAPTPMKPEDGGDDDRKSSAVPELTPTRPDAILARVKDPTPRKPEEEDDNVKSSAVPKLTPTRPNAILARVKDPTPRKPEKGNDKVKSSAVLEAVTPARPSVDKEKVPVDAIVLPNVGGVLAGSDGAATEGQRTAAAAAATTAVGGGSNTHTDGRHAPTMTPRRNSNSNSKAQLPQSNSGSPSFAQQLLENRQNMRSRSSRNMQRQGQSGAPKQQRKLTPPPSKSMPLRGPSAAAIRGDIHARNLNDAIENTFFEDYWE